jgi:hypothetical protein
MNETLSAYFSAMGKKGGKARAKKLSKKRLSEIGKMRGRPRKLDR